MFDLTSEKSYDQVKSWLESIIKIKGGGYPIILVGSKVEKVDERVIDKETALAMAKEIECNYHEISASTGEGVDEMMNDILRTVYEKQIGPQSLEDIHHASHTENTVDLTRPSDLTEERSKCSC